MTNPHGPSSRPNRPPIDAVGGRSPTNPLAVTTAAARPNLRSYPGSRTQWAEAPVPEDMIEMTTLYGALIDRLDLPTVGTVAVVGPSGGGKSTLATEFALRLDASLLILVAKCLSAFRSQHRGLRRVRWT